MSKSMSVGAQVLIVRDIPSSCICVWDWNSARWVRIKPLLGCPWHGV